MPTRVSLNAEEMALVKAYRKATPGTRMIMDAAVREHEQRPDLVHELVLAWRAKYEGKS